MQHHYDSCVCDQHALKPYRELTVLLLDIWQRKYDQRPYSTMLLNKKSFETTYHRIMDVHDYQVLLQFLAERNIENFELNYMPLPDLHITRALVKKVSTMLNVSLCHVTLPAEALETLANDIDDCNIRTLRLSGNAFGREHADHLRAFLLKNSTIRYLDVGYCSIDNISFAVVADGILNCTSLRAIDVSRILPCHSHHISDESKTALILSILIWRNSLYEVHCKHCQLDGHDIAPIAECLERCSNLVYLDLGSNKIGPHGTELIFEALKKVPHLIGLDISHNLLGTHGGEIIAHLLPFTKIRYLDIGYNDIPGDVMRMVLCSIKKSHPIRILNIVGNQFESNVASVLKRQMQARILLVHSIDVTTTYDADEKSYRIVPCVNVRAQYNQRYHRVFPFIRSNDAAPKLLWHEENKRKLLVNGLYIDPIFVDSCGRIYTLDKYGKPTQPECTKLFNF